nr:Z1 domain-containing protein [Streptomyces sp. HNM0575]
MLRPVMLRALVDIHGEEAEPGADLSEGAFRKALTEPSEGALLRLWNSRLLQWDIAEGSWTKTEPRTAERRFEVYDRLGLEAETRQLLTELAPVSRVRGEVVISGDTPTVWDAESRDGHEWYWPRYKEYLEEQQGWDSDSVGNLDSASERVVRHLADPTAAKPYASRGLVVGYVQSGKTANFTGVIAKALDGGYRLVIVLGGRLNLLRAQTQRRIDKELVGRENLLRNVTDELEMDYAADTDWIDGEFLEHGVKPSDAGAFDIIRLTTRDDDYRALNQGISALERDKRERSLPLYDPVNLHSSNAQLMVVKKHTTVLQHLIKDLKRVGDELLQELPVLVIDDESDEASVNTTLSKNRDSKRTAINQHISSLLGMLPRAQYVGYTATPYANVFVDPSDDKDIFPRDFIVSLDRPHGYMGAREFHDFHLGPEDERPLKNSNERCYVRDIRNTDGRVDEDAELREAMDMFVLSGAMKLYREGKAGLKPFRHHTMLVHESQRQDDHRELLVRVRRLWTRSEYTGEAGQKRLRRLFDDDLKPVSLARAGELPVPESYDELQPYASEAWRKIGADNQPVIVVNGDKEIENREVDFEGTNVWKIIIGGQKLSRGFTVEGLTVSYYRRLATNGSTLMQMGRWFGFRKGYQDLVRLYIDRSVERKHEDVDLYSAFEAICRDEEDFREQLRQYSVTVNGKPQVTPAQVPPLVSQRLPWLRPTSKNKMYNTQVASQASPGKITTLTCFPKTESALAHNTRKWEPVFDRLSSEATLFTGQDTKGVVRSFDALTAVIDPQEFLDIAKDLMWLSNHDFAPHLQHLRELTEAEERLNDWLVLAPQHQRTTRNVARLEAVDRTLSWFQRQRRRGRGDAFGEITEPRHRPVAERIAGATTDYHDSATESFVRSRRGVILLYPVVEKPGESVETTQKTGVLDPKSMVTAFSFVSPMSARRHDEPWVRFMAIDTS